MFIIIESYNNVSLRMVTISLIALIVSASGQKQIETGNVARAKLEGNSKGADQVYW